MLQQATDYRIYDQAFFLSEIESAEGKEEKKEPLACINTRKFKGLDSREITSSPEIKKVIYMARHFNHRQK